MSHLNHLGQPLGFPLPDWTVRSKPSRAPLEGRLVTVEALDPARHGDGLFAANALDREGRNWTYLPYGPITDRAAYGDWLASVAAIDDPLFYAILDKTDGQAVGVVSLMRINPTAGVIEIGHVNLSPRLQRQPAATEAMSLLMHRVFAGLGYRRYEWKCDALNMPSRRAAERLGFRFEGIFRQATLYKGRNRDTAWFSIIDQEWPTLAAAFEAWLDPANFDGDGSQKRTLAAFR